MGADMRKNVIGAALIGALMLWAIVPYALLGYGDAKYSSVTTVHVTERRTMNEEDLKLLVGGEGNDAQCTAWVAVCAVAGAATFFGGVAAIIAGPTAAVCLIDAVFDLSGCHEYAPFGHN